MACSYATVDGTSEEQILALKDMLNEGQDYLRLWAERCEKECPSYEHDITPPGSTLL